VLVGKPKAAREYFARLLPSLERRAMAVFRYLDPDAKEEAVAEVTALCWKDYVNCIQKRKRVTSGNLAYYAIRHVRDGNLFNGKLSTDALGERAKLLGRTRVESIYAASGVNGWRGDGSWRKQPGTSSRGASMCRGRGSPSDGAIPFRTALSKGVRAEPVQKVREFRSRFHTIEGEKLYAQ